MSPPPPPQPENEAANSQDTLKKCETTTTTSPEESGGEELTSTVDSASTKHDAEDGNEDISPMTIKENITAVPAENSIDTAEVTPQKTTEANDVNEQEEEDEEEGAFAFMDFVPLDKLKLGGRVCDVCMGNVQEDPSSPQPNLACTIWQSVENPKSKKWYYCLDCLVEDYETFPDYDELMQYNALRNVNPATYQEHLQLMKTKCSRQRNPCLPTLPSTFLNSAVPDDDDDDDDTKDPKPLPSDTISHFVTPPSKPLRSAVESSTMPLQESEPVNVTAKALAVHKKWQEQAEAMGGKGAKIVVSTEKAKKIIYEALKEEYRPMNFNDIYKLLKATIPQPVLSSTLKNMADPHGSNPFTDSDDEDVSTSKGEEKNKEGDFYGRQTLVLKAGRNPQTSLYHFNYKKTKEMDSEERQALFAAMSQASNTADSLKSETAANQAQAAKLWAEPTNVELITCLSTAEKETATLREQVAESRKLQVHTGTRIGLQKKIQKMAAHWSKRKRMCLSFLSALEENTEGTVTIRKSLAGDGPLQLDSDEAVIQAELGMAKQKSLKRKMGKSHGRAPFKMQKTEPTLSSALSSSLVAVRLAKGGKVERIYYREDDDEN